MLFKIIYTMVGAVYYEEKKWNHMQFSRVERELANRALCFLWFLRLVVWDKGGAGPLFLGYSRSYPGWQALIPAGSVVLSASLQRETSRGQTQGDLRERRAGRGWPSSTLLHCWCPWGKETNSVHLHGLVSFLLHSLLTFPSLHLRITIINDK